MENNNQCKKNRKNKNRHKKVSQLKKDRQLSRDKRRETKKKVQQFENLQTCSNIFSVLFIDEETEHNERILCQKVSFDDDYYSLGFPTITFDEVSSAFNKEFYEQSHDFMYELCDYEKAQEKLSLVIRNLIKSSFEIEADEVTLLPGKPIIIVKNIRTNKSDLDSLVIRTFNPCTWFNNLFSSSESMGFYKGKNTDPYLASTQDLGNVLISSGFLNTILDYRILSGKLKEFSYESFDGVSLEHYSGTMDFVQVFAYDNKMKVLEKEEEEVKKLLFGDQDGVIVQDINKFVRFKQTFEKYVQKIRIEDFVNALLEGHYFPVPGDAFAEYNKVASQYFHSKRK